MRYLLTSVMCVLLHVPFLHGQDIASISTGNWNEASTWNCNCIPPDGSNVTISTGDSVWLSKKPTTGDLTIESGAVLNTKNQRTAVNGNLQVNGHLYSNSSFTLGGTNITISGTGTINNNKSIDLEGSTVAFPSGTDLDILGTLSIGSGVIVSNLGALSIDRLDAANASSTWTNRAGASLSVFDRFLEGGTLYAAASGNTIHLEKNGKLNIPVPGDKYFHLEIAGAGQSVLTGNTEVAGNLSIQGGTFKSASYTLTVGGN
ncbi:MAG: hypothetical protein KDD36_10145 [Flavobacteriales bacterium]|nr:hypothetical protein [Flavobacteriales bacterium]